MDGGIYSAAVPIDYNYVISGFRIRTHRNGIVCDADNITRLRLDHCGIADQQKKKEFHMVYFWVYPLFTTVTFISLCVVLW